MNLHRSPHQDLTRRQNGMAVIAVMALVAIVLIYTAVNLRTLHHLNREVKLIEEKQIRRLQAHPVSTNALSVAATNHLREHLQEVTKSLSQ